MTAYDAATSCTKCQIALKSTLSSQTTGAICPYTHTEVESPVVEAMIQVDGTAA